MNRLKYGSIAVGAPGSIARRKSEIEDCENAKNKMRDKFYISGKVNDYIEYVNLNLELKNLKEKSK